MISKCLQLATRALRGQGLYGRLPILVTCLAEGEVQGKPGGERGQGRRVEWIDHVASEESEAADDKVLIHKLLARAVSTMSEVDQ